VFLLAVYDTTVGDHCVPVGPVGPVGRVTMYDTNCMRSSTTICHYFCEMLYFVYINTHSAFVSLHIFHSIWFCILRM
jgi:hypothetical protein